MKKGITILSLGVAIAIIILLGSVIVISSRDSIDNLNKVKFVTDYISVESALDNYYSLNDNYPLLEEISIRYDSSAVSQFEGENITDSTVQLYKLDVAALGLDNLVLGSGNDADDYYAVSVVTGELYYVAGFKYNNNVYYKVTDDLNEDYD